MLGLHLQQLLVGVECCLVVVIAEECTGISRQGFLAFGIYIEGIAEMLRQDSGEEPELFASSSKDESLLFDYLNTVDKKTA